MANLVLKANLHWGRGRSCQA